MADNPRLAQRRERAAHRALPERERPLDDVDAMDHALRVHASVLEVAEEPGLGREETACPREEGLERVAPALGIGGVSAEGRLETPAEREERRPRARWVKGALCEEPKFDLQLLLMQAEAEPAQATLRQLTHDLAEAFYAGVSEEWQFPDVLRNIVCLLPAPVDSDELLILEWCV